MARRDPFRGHRFPKDVILLAVRWYYYFPLSYRDVRDMLAERGITVGAASIHRWVRKFSSEIRKRALSRHRSWRGQTWHMDVTLHPGEWPVVLSLAPGSHGRQAAQDLQRDGERLRRCTEIPSGHTVAGPCHQPSGLLRYVVRSDTGTYL